MKKSDFRPESLMMSHGYNPEWSEGAIKCPIFQTSTFVFKTAEEGKALFEVAYGLRERDPSEELGLIYSRLNNPDLEILENRLCLWDKADDCAVFESGMSAISTVLLEFLRPGDVLLYSRPVYGGTNHFITKVLPQYGIKIIGFTYNDTEEDIIRAIEEKGYEKSLKLVYAETPANPTNSLIDISMCRRIADHFQQDDSIPVAIDNTYMGPLWQHPIEHGADMVIYSATKYIGGHSDLIAGAVLGNQECMNRIKGMRTFLGNMAGPWTGWLLMRSLETLKVRMDQQEFNAARVADYLSSHSKVEKVYYLGMIDQTETRQLEIFDRQCLGKGAMVSFDITGGEKEAFRFLNNLKLVKLAVSLGSTESLAEHPATMTHADVDQDEKDLLCISPKMIRLSVGVEYYEDLISDLQQALETV